MTVGVFSELIRGDIYCWGELMAGACLGSLPIVIAYVFFLDYYVSGLTAGAVKERPRGPPAGGRLAQRGRDKVGSRRASRRQFLPTTGGDAGIPAAGRPPGAPPTPGLTL